jgi:diphthine-ammonia ligase
MIAADINAILVKVASLGLLPKHLGKSLSEMAPVLKGLNQKFGVHICGEGGEFESLTLDCPLFKYNKIVLDETEIVNHDHDDLAPVAYLKLRSYHLEKKCDEQPEKQDIVIVDPLYRLEIPDSIIGAQIPIVSLSSGT